MQHFLDKLGQNIIAMKSIFDSIKDLIFLMEKDGDTFRYLFANQSALHVLNVKGEIVGRRIEDQMSEEQAPKLISQYQQVVATQQSLSFEEKVDSVDGEFIGETSLNPILTEEGNCNYVLGIVRDVTERRRKEKELTETKRKLESNQERLHSLVKYNRDAVFELDLQGNFINMNERTSDITGYEVNELIGTSFKPLIVEESVEEINSHFKNALNGKKKEYDVCIQKRNGQKVLLHVKNIPIVVDDIIVGVYGIAKDITEENKLEQLLKESEQRYKSLFENHPDAIFSIDLDGNYTSGNPAAEKISGYSMENLKGNPFWHLVIQEDRDYAFNRFKQVIEQKKPESYQIRMKHGLDHQIDVFVTCIPIFVDNQVVGLYGVSKDITEQKRAQAALVETKEELETFWNYSVDPVFFFSNGKILKVNPAFEKMFGFSEKEICEKTDLIFAPNIELEAKEINEKIRNGETITYHETKRMTKSGETLDIIASYTPVQNEKGEIVGATSFYKDVTDVKKVERELQKSEKKFRLIAENAFDVIKLINLSGIVEYVSPANERILGYTYSEYAGQPYTAYIHPEDIARLTKRFKNILNGKKPSPVEIRILHKNGHWIWLEVTTTPILDVNGKVKQLVSISRDITERRRYQDALTKMAFYDYLTGLPNRRTFDDRLDMAIHQAKRSKKKVAVMMLDGRKFKMINDTFGHDAGDAVIKEFARRIQKSVRETDTVSRLGGDEMGMILTELDSMETAEVIAKRILHSLDKPLNFNNNEITLEAGIGIAFYPDHSVDKRQLVKHADEALYIAKKSNQNEYRIYQ
jgi:diguanylate cyclase (GGDEF)-like protein/PAS domain S-box-containing protein